MQSKVFKCWSSTYHPLPHLLRLGWWVSEDAVLITSRVLHWMTTSPIFLTVFLPPEHFWWSVVSSLRTGFSDGNQMILKNFLKPKTNNKKQIIIITKKV